MSSILEHFDQKALFRPSSPEEVLALQIAGHLNDRTAVRRHLHYLEHLGFDRVLRALAAARLEDDSAAAYHSSLTNDIHEFS